LSASIYVRNLWYALIGGVLALASASAAEPGFAFDVSYAAGSRDVSGQVMGGTEIRDLAVQGGKLFAANGYWMDRADPTGPGPQILVLDVAGKPWRVDHEFDERMPNGRRRHTAISVLSAVTFRTDQYGAALREPVSRLLASTWDVTGRRMVFARDGKTGEWSGAFIAQSAPAPRFLPQIRSFGFHRDRRTGADMAFAGDTEGVFAGAYDPGVPGQIKWDTTPELATKGVGAADFPGLSRGLRISSFAEAGGRLFAAIGQQVWVREDGSPPQWRRIYTNPSPHFSETGLRGLTAVSEPGTGEFLLAAVEGMQSRIVRIDPATGAETTDLELGQMLDKTWGTRVSYVIAAYNDMTPLRHTASGDDLLLGLEAYIPASSPRPPGHTVLDLNHGVEGGGWFLVRHPGGRYELHQVTLPASRFFPVFGENFVSVRTFAASPFPQEKNTFYIGGYDCNEVPAHDTAWIVRGVLDSAR
jgi:hypothetical protein